MPSATRSPSGYLAKLPSVTIASKRCPARAIQLERNDAAQAAAHQRKALDAQRVEHGRRRRCANPARVISDGIGVRFTARRCRAARSRRRRSRRRTLRAADPRSRRSSRRRARKRASSTRARALAAQRRALRYLRRRASEVHSLDHAAHAFASDEGANAFQRPRVENVCGNQAGPPRLSDGELRRARSPVRWASLSSENVTPNVLALRASGAREIEPRRLSVDLQRRPRPRRRRKDRIVIELVAGKVASKRRPVGWPMILTYGFSQARMSRAVISSRDWPTRECTEPITMSSFASTASS